LEQLWLFWVVPLAGAAVAGVVYRWVGGANPLPEAVTGTD
jgi:aquaporin Z